MAVLLAVAVAAMPATAGAVTAAAASGAGATAHVDAMPADCPHHRAPADRGSKGTDDGAGLASCAAHCFNYAGTAVPSIAMRLRASPLAPLLDTGRIASNLAAPPFRPPRI
jgi:hypothetical protein